MLPVGVSLADVSERTYSEAQGPREAESSTIVGPVSSTRSYSSFASLARFILSTKVIENT